MALTNLKIKSAAVGERHHDGRGLYLTLSAPGRGKWTMRYMMKLKALMLPNHHASVIPTLLLQYPKQPFLNCDAWQQPLSYDLDLERC